MTAGEWNTGWVRCIGIHLNGLTLNDVNAFGEPITDDTFLLLLNPGHESISFHLPKPRNGCSWEAMIDTRHAVDAIPVAMVEGAPYDLSARCSALLREVPCARDSSNGK
jgi:glycogen operon protein